jgi:hypothetical protein
MKPQKLLLILISIVILIAIAITASASVTTYPNLGYLKYNPYYANAMLKLTPSTALLIPGTQTLNGSVPLTEDLDYDGSNEIIMITSTNLLMAQNFTGTAFSNLASISIGSQDRYGVPIHTTPGIVSFYGDDTRQVVMTNSTHFIVYNYTYAAGFVEEQNQLIPTTNSTGTFAGTPAYLTIKCSSTGNYGGIIACYTVQIDRTAGGLYNVKLYEYDLTNNLVYNTTLAYAGAWPTVSFPQYYQPIIRDLNNDGIQDVVIGVYDLANGDMYATYVQQTGAAALTNTTTYKFDMAAGYVHTDLAVGDFDGAPSNGLEISNFFREGASNYDARIINRLGTVLNNDFSIVPPVTGSTLFSNLAIAQVSGQELFCAYIHYNTTSQLYCFNGNTNQVDNTTGSTIGYTTNGGVFSIVDQYTNAQGLINGGYASKFMTYYPFLLNWHTAVPNTIQTPFYSSNGYTHAAVFDIRDVGSDDVFYSNTTNYAVLNTLSSNEAPTVASYGVGTGNPSCLNVIQKYKIIIDDAEDNTITCTLTYSYYNNTLISNQTDSEVPGVQFQFLISLTEVGSFKAKAWCGDYHHPNSTTHEWLQTVSNATNCVQQDNGGSDIEVVVVVPSGGGGSGLTDDEIASTIGLLWTTNSKLKLLLGILIVIVIMIRVAQWTKSGMVIIASGFLGLIISVALTLISVYVMIIALVALAMILFLGNSIGSTDNGG